MAEEKKAQHLCPSCGYQHDSEGNEVAPIIINQIVAPPPEPPAPPPPPPPSLSTCPLCVPSFTTDDPAAFNAHMAAGKHSSAQGTLSATTVGLGPAAGLPEESLSAQVARILGS